MISISTQEASSYFTILAEVPGTLSGTKSRRVSVISTLDGSSIVNDSGYTDTDRTISVDVKVNETKYNILDYMLENYNLWNVVVGGEYLPCNVRSVSIPRGNKCKLTLAVTA